jgi:hypothetical protein
MRPSKESEAKSRGATKKESAHFFNFFFYDAHSTQTVSLVCHVTAFSRAGITLAHFLNRSVAAFLLIGDSYLSAIIDVGIIGARERCSEKVYLTHGVLLAGIYTVTII